MQCGGGQNICPQSLAREFYGEKFSFYMFPVENTGYSGRMEDK